MQQKEMRGVVWPKRKGISKASADACIEFLSMKNRSLTFGVLRRRQRNSKITLSSKMYLFLSTIRLASSI